MSRILWVSNAPFCPSGYGEQANLFVPRLQALGHDVAVLANHGLMGAQMELGGIHHYPGDGRWGNKHIAAAANHWNADLVIVLHDAWVMHPDQWGDNPPPVAIWAPVDHNPMPPLVLGVLSHERVRPIAMSRFGEQMMRNAKLDPAYVPHGVDTNLFRPQPELRKTVRDLLDIPQDAFLVGMVAANRDVAPDRKSFAKSFLAFGQFAQKNPDAFLYAHSQAKVEGGLDLDILSAVSFIPPGRVRFTPDDAWKLGIPRDFVSTLYSAFDVLLAPSMGEGFGIPILEAQACGVPVITSPHSAMQELGQNGWLVDGDPWWDGLQTAFFFDPHVASIHQRLEDAYADRGNTERSEACVEFAHAYDADLVTEKFWKPALAKLLGVDAGEASVSRAERRRIERAARKQPQEVVAR